MGNTILKQIDKNFFQVMEEFLWQHGHEFQRKGFRIEDIQIFIPGYIVKMYQHYLCENYGAVHNFTEAAEKFFTGIKIIDNYDNTIVVSVKDIHLRSKFKPAILPVFGQELTINQTVKG